MVKISLPLGDSFSSNNSFYCPHCKKRAPHYRLTLTEYCAIDDPNDKWGIAGAKYLDLLGITKIVCILLGVSHWKCGNCGLATIRNSKGEVDTISKFGK